MLYSTQAVLQFNGRENGFVRFALVTADNPPSNPITLYIEEDDWFMMKEPEEVSISILPGNTLDTDYKQEFSTSVERVDAFNGS